MYTVLYLAFIFSSRWILKFIFSIFIKKKEKQIEEIDKTSYIISSETDKNYLNRLLNFSYSLIAIFLILLLYVIENSIYRFPEFSFFFSLVLAIIVLVFSIKSIYDALMAINEIIVLDDESITKYSFSKIPQKIIFCEILDIQEFSARKKLPGISTTAMYWKRSDRPDRLEELDNNPTELLVISSDQELICSSSTQYYSKIEDYLREKNLLR